MKFKVKGDAQILWTGSDGKKRSKPVKVDEIVEINELQKDEMILGNEGAIAINRIKNKYINSSQLQDVDFNFLLVEVHPISSAPPPDNK